MFTTSQIFLLLVASVAAGSLDHETAWHKYVRAPVSTAVRPRAILDVNGSVSKPQALVAGDGVTTLSRPSNASIIPSLTLDFGLNIVGFTQIQFDGASDNQPGIRLTFSETKDYLRNVSDFTRSDNGDMITPGTDQHAVPSKPTTWRNHHGCQFDGNKVCSDGLHGFRYLRIALDALRSDAPYAQPFGTVNISAIELHYYGYLAHPNTFTGNFECSDPHLTQWWYDAAYTNDMCTATFTRNTTDPRDAFSPSLNGELVLQDGAKRDRDPYVGDIAVSGRTIYLTHAQNSIAAKNVLADLAEHQRADGWMPPASISNYTLPLFDYPLWWVVSSWEYVLYTGDVDFAEFYWSNLVAVMDDFYPSVTNTSKLLSKGLGVTGTEEYGDYAFLPRTGEVTYYNALYVYALQHAAEWAAQLNNSSARDIWAARGDTVARAINANLWDPLVGAYLDSANLTTSFNATRHAQDGNALAVLAGVAPPDRAKSALRYLSTNMSRPYGNAFYDGPLPNVDSADQRVYAFLSFFELQARLAQPTIADHLSAIEEIQRLYGWMSSHDPGVTFWEGIGPNGSLYEQGYTSMAHGWSTGIVGVLSNYVLGVRPTKPGFRAWEVKPRVSGLKWARGVVGGVEVCWEVRDDGSFEMIVEVSEGTKGVVYVPVKNGQRVWWDEKALEGHIGDGYVKIYGVGHEKHHFVAR